MNPAQQYQMIEMTSPDGDDEDEEDDMNGVQAKHNKKYDTSKRSQRVGQVLTAGIVIALGFIFVLFVFTFV